MFEETEVRVTKDYAWTDKVKTITFREGESHKSLKDGMIGWMKDNYSKMSQQDISRKIEYIDDDKIVLNLEGG